LNRDSADRRRGLLIVFEGIDGVGKSTQAGTLMQWLQSMGHQVVRSKEPTDGPFGSQLRQSMTTVRLDPNEELQLFLSDRKQHVRELIEPSLREAKIVLLDRYYFSTVAYQGARGFDPDTLREQNEAFAPAPDLLVILDMPAEDSIARICATRAGATDTFESKDALARSRDIFLSLGRTLPYAVVLDARKSQSAIQSAIRTRVSMLLNP